MIAPLHQWDEETAGLIFIGPYIHRGKKPD